VVGGVIVASLIIFYFFFPYSSNFPIEPVPEKSVVEEKSPLAPSPPVAATPVLQKKNLLSKRKNLSLLLLPSQPQLLFQKKSLSSSSLKRSGRHG
jgi:hypothetical protein